VFLESPEFPPPNSEVFFYLGQLAMQGERGLPVIPSNWIFRWRYNSFYDYLKVRMLD